MSEYHISILDVPTKFSRYLTEIGNTVFDCELTTINVNIESLF
jgi:hypothetical protein